MSMLNQAFADSMTYTFRPLEGAGRPQRVRLPQPFQFPDIQAFLIGEVANEFVVIQPLPINIEIDEDKSYIVSDDVF